MATKNKLDDELDALFKLPLTEFTAARNTLAARLKKAGNRDEAEQVKTLAKPTLSAWAVNQLYWTHADAFTELIAAGKRFGKAGDMRELFNARREAISALTRHSVELLRDAGHNPTPDMIRRITTTLEALSAYSSRADAPIPGRLTEDIDPPGFESLAALIPNVARSERPEPARVVPFPSSNAALERAEEALRKAQVSAHDAAAALEAATDHANQMEKQRRDAEERFKSATVAAEQARQKMQHLAAEVKRAGDAAKNAEREVEKARKKIGTGRR